MATRRSRLSIKPNLGPKVGGTKSGSTKHAPDKKGKQPPASPVPKKETLERLRKKVSDEDNDKELEKDASVTTDELERQTQPINNHVENAGSTDSKSEAHNSEIISPVQTTSEETKDMAISGVPDKSKTVAPGKDGGDVIPVLPKILVPPKNKVQMITRNRLPKARPNLSDAGRPKKAPELTIKGGANQSGPSSPMKSPRPIISQSPDKALSSPEKSVVVARELQVHYPTTEAMDTSGQASRSDTRIPGETTVAERRHRNLSGVDVPPVIERRQRQMSTSETVAGEKRHRHTSVAETSAPKRKKPTKVDAPTDVPVDRTKIKMGDLIYWNPSSNPMKKKPGQDKKKKKSVSPSDDEEEGVVSLTAPTAEEEKVDDPEATEDEVMPVPQVKIGPDGNIIINEESLVIKNNDSVIEEDGDVIDETDINVTYTSFRKQRQKLSWSEKETEKFYKALSYIGTDFSLIHSVFPKRSRNDIKKKFAIEDKKNRDKVEAALRNKKPFNLAVFEEDEEMDIEVTKPARKSGKRAKKENKTAEKSTRPKPRKEWKYYYNENEDSEEVETKKAAVKRQQVEEARRRLLATRNSSQNNPQGVEESNEIVEILMNMSKGNNPAPPATDTPHVENVMVMQSGMPVVDIGTNTEQLVQLLQTSGQAALIGDNVNEPLILVYNRPTTPGGETVIHVYKIQPENNSSAGVNTSTPPQQTERPSNVTNDNTTDYIDISLTRSDNPSNTDSTNICTSDLSTQVRNQVDINLTSSTETTRNIEGQPAPVLCVKNQGEVIGECESTGHIDHNLHNYSETVPIGESIVSRDQSVTQIEVPKTNAIQNPGEPVQDQNGGDNSMFCSAEQKDGEKNESQGSVSGVESISELGEQYIDDVTSVVPNL